MTQSLSTAAPPWGWLQLILFRCLVLYVVMFTFSHLFIAPIGEEIMTIWEKPWDSFVPWVGLHVFGIEEMTARPQGSGDTTYNYVQIFAMLLIALVGGLVWSAIERRRRNYDTYAYGFSVYLRYYLAFVMFYYGIAKVIKIQFPFPFLDRLVQPYGESSPFGLLWTFMGFSTLYTVFAGLSEVIGGLLLLFRRTTTLGALIVIGVMANVAMMNFSYDVPVKIFSVHLLLIACLLVLPDARRLVNVFFLNKPALPADLSNPIPGGWPTYFRYGTKIAVIAYVLIASTIETMGIKQQIRDFESAPLRGIYEAEHFVLNGDTLAPALADTLRWRRLVVYGPNDAWLYGMDDTRRRFVFEPDTAAQTVAMYSRQDTTNKSLLAYAAPDSNQFHLEGLWNGDTLVVDFRRKDERDFLLVNRGFHWINEFPFNR